MQQGHGAKRARSGQLDQSGQSFGTGVTLFCVCCVTSPLRRATPEHPKVTLKLRGEFRLL